METTRPAPLASAGIDTAQLAKAALRRLAIAKLEPTPENYARAFRQEAGETAVGAGLPERAQRVVDRLAARAFDADAGAATGGASTPGMGPAAEFSLAMQQGRWEQAERVLQAAPAQDGSAIAALIERIVRGIERGSRGWTPARKKEGLQRVLGGSRSDAKRLQQRLSQLVASWDTEPADDAVATEDIEAGVVGGPAPMAPPTVAPSASASSAFESSVSASSTSASFASASGATSSSSSDVSKAVPANVDLPPLSTTTASASVPWPRAVDALGGAVQQALPVEAEAPHPIALALAELTARLRGAEPAPELIDELETLCRRALPVIQHRQHLLDQLTGLCTELTASLTDLAENDSWAKGQCQAMQVRIDEGLSARGIRAVSELLRETRERQGQLRDERTRARDSLKGLINQMLAELGELGAQTGNFHDSVGRYADVIEKADSLESLAGAVREMVEESHTVQALVQQTQTRLRDEHAKASDLTLRVTELESEMRRLSDEVSTDQLTQVANRRGLLQAFEAEQLRMAATQSNLLVGLLDIDNFKRLNDELGHSVGDEALKSLSAVVAKTLRPSDLVARYGGEEFVVLLPETPLGEGQQILTRLQRSLTGGLFLHENKQVFVTFSAGVTEYRSGERIEEALERADQALYEAKRTGKNRTCLA